MFDFLSGPDAGLIDAMGAAARAESFPETPSTSSPGFMSPPVVSGCLEAVVPAAGAVLAAEGAGAGAAGRFASRRLGPVAEFALLPAVAGAVPLAGAAVFSAASAGGVAAGAESHPATSSATASAAPRLAMAPDRKILRHMGLWTMGVPGYDCRVLKVSRGI
jgi:hypothetical protein